MYERKTTCLINLLRLGMSKFEGIGPWNALSSKCISSVKDVNNDVITWEILILRERVKYTENWERQLS